MLLPTVMTGVVSRLRFYAAYEVGGFMPPSDAVFNSSKPAVTPLDGGYVLS